MLVFQIDEIKNITIHQRTKYNQGLVTFIPFYFISNKKNLEVKRTNFCMNNRKFLLK